MSKKENSKGGTGRLTPQRVKREIESLPAEEIEKAIPEEVKQLILQRHSYFSGPIPPPELLASYKEIEPSIVNRILDLAKEEADHRRTLENKEDARLDRLSRRLDRGQIFGFTIAVLGIGLSGVLAFIGAPVPSAWVGGATILSLASLFVAGQRKKLPEKKGK